MEEKKKPKTKGFALNLGISNGKLKNRMIYQGRGLADLSVAIAILESNKTQLIEEVRKLTGQMKKE
tara:strand:- start:204 stop:401 length:198 start_codon:yes stop_codon:yes gene_type:complete